MGIPTVILINTSQNIMEILSKIVKKANISPLQKKRNPSPDLPGPGPDLPGPGPDQDPEQDPDLPGPGPEQDPRGNLALEEH
jgi:hypothetical protein